MAYQSLSDLLDAKAMQQAQLGAMGQESQLRNLQMQTAQQDFNDKAQLRNLMQTLPTNGDLSSIMPQLRQLGPQGIDVAVKMAQSSATMEQIDRQNAIRKQIANATQGGGIGGTDGATSGQGAGGMNGYRQKMAMVYMQNGDPDTAMKYMPKVKDWKEVQTPNGVQYAPLFEDGGFGAPVPMNVAKQLHFGDTGGRSNVAFDPYTAQQLSNGVAKTPTPDAIMTNNRALESQNIERVKADPSGLLGLNKNVSPTSSAGSGLTGKALLDTLPPGIATQVKSMADGRMAITPMSMRNPQISQILQLAQQYEPGTDQTTYNARNRTQIDAASGNIGKSAKAINQALAHADLLSQNITNLDNFSGMATPLNMVANPVSKLFGDSRQGVMQQTALALSSELRKVFAASGGGSLQELKDWESSFPVNGSKNAQQEYLKNGMHLLSGGIDALQNQYVAGMQKPDANIRDLLTPKSQQILQKFGISDNYNQPSQQPGNATPQPSAQPQTAASLPNPAQLPNGAIVTDSVSGRRMMVNNGKYQPAR